MVLRDLLPAGLTYVSHHASRGTYDPDTGRWEVGALAGLTSPSDGRQRRSAVDPGPGGPGGGSFPAAAGLMGR